MPEEREEARAEFVEAGRQVYVGDDKHGDVWCSCKVGAFFDLLSTGSFVVFRSELEQVGWSEDYHDDDDAVIGYSVFGGHDPDHSWNDWERHDGARYGSWAVYRIREAREEEQ